jgi:hypothetical protein
METNEIVEMMEPIIEEKASFTFIPVRPLSREFLYEKVCSRMNSYAVGCIGNGLNTCGEEQEKSPLAADFSLLVSVFINPYGSTQRGQGVSVLSTSVRC